MEHSKRISENPSYLEPSNQIKFFFIALKFVSSIPFSKRLFPKLTKISQEISTIKEQMDRIIDAPDEFNNLFSNLGWVAYESMKLETMEEAINLAKNISIEEAESFLTESYDDETLYWGISWTTSIEAFRCRHRLILLAKEDYLAERYHACIPLLLALLDGASNDVSNHVGIFSETSNMTVVDSVAAHPTGLQKLSEIFRTSRKKTNHEAIYIPYRNGILHGRELNFDNKTVAAKCWAALFATSDWAKSLHKTPKQEATTSWRELIDNHKNLSRQKELLNNWKPRTSESFNYLPSSTIDLLPLGSPEKTTFTFLNHWCKANYGALSKQVLDYRTEISDGKRIYHIKELFSRNIPDSFRIISVDDEAPAISNVLTELSFTINNRTITDSVIIRLVFNDQDNNLLVRGDACGTWKIIQNSLYTLLSSLEFT